MNKGREVQHRYQQRVSVNSIMRYKESRIQSRDKSASKKSMCADTSCSTIHDKDQLGYSQARNNQSRLSRLAEENEALRERVKTLTKNKEFEYSILNFYNKVFAKLLNQPLAEGGSFARILEQSVEIVRVLGEADIEVGVDRDQFASLFKS